MNSLSHYIFILIVTKHKVLVHEAIAFRSHHFLTICWLRFSLLYCIYYFPSLRIILVLYYIMIFLLSNVTGSPLPQSNKFNDKLIEIPRAYLFLTYF